MRCENENPAVDFKRREKIQCARESSSVWWIRLVIIMRRRLCDFSHRVVSAAPNLMPTNMGRRHRQTHHYMWCPPSPIYKYTILFYVIKKELWTADRFVSTPKLFSYNIIYIGITPRMQLSYNTIMCIRLLQCSSSCIYQDIPGYSGIRFVVTTVTVVVYKNMIEQAMDTRDWNAALIEFGGQSMCNRCFRVRNKI